MGEGRKGGGVGRAGRVQLVNPWFVESLGSITPSFALPAKEPRTNEHQSGSQNRGLKRRPKADDGRDFGRSVMNTDASPRHTRPHALGTTGDLDQWREGRETSYSQQS